jgi:hypothetical protein
MISVPSPYLRRHLCSYSSLSIPTEGNDHVMHMLLVTIVRSFYARSQNSEKLLLASSCPSVYPSAWNNLASTEWIFLKFDIYVYFENLLRKFRFH